MTGILRQGGASADGDSGEPGIRHGGYNSDEISVSTPFTGAVSLAFGTVSLPLAMVVNETSLGQMSTLKECGYLTWIRKVLSSIAGLFPLLAGFGKS